MGPVTNSDRRPITAQRMGRPLLLLIVVSAALAAAQDAHALLYDVDFSTPPHTIGLPPATGAGPAPRETVSQVVAGNPTVVASLGALTDRPLRLTSYDGTRDQVSFRIDDLPAADYYCLEADVLVTQADANGQLDLTIDAATLPTIHVQGDGTISVFVSGVTSSPVLIGNYTIGDIVSLQVGIDLVTDHWTITLDGQLALDDSIGWVDAIQSVRVATAGVTGAARVRGGIDNLTVNETVCSDQLCDRLAFDDLAAGSSYPVFSSFVSEGVTIDVDPHFILPGPCSGILSSGSAHVEVGLQNACRTGNEIHLDGVSLDFDFGGPVNDVVIYYGELSGTVSIGVNGECETVADLPLLDGTDQNGVAIRVFDYGPPGGCGAIRLLGEISELRIGGQDLWIDALSYCRSCPARLHSAFDDQTVGTIYQSGDQFVSGEARYEVHPFYPPGIACAFATDGSVEIQDGQGACGAGNEIALILANVRIDFGDTADWIVLNYREFGLNTNRNLQINGDCRNVDNLNALNGAEVGGVRVIVADFGPPGRSCGTFYAIGPINQFEIGGTMFIDNVRACTSATVGIEDQVPTPQAGGSAALLRLEQNQPNPFNPATAIAFELAAPMRARLTIYDVTGRVVQTLVDGMLAGGRHEVRWDGRDADGGRVPSGVYAYRLEAGGMAETRRMIILK